MLTHRLVCSADLFPFLLPDASGFGQFRFGHESAAHVCWRLWSLLSGEDKVVLVILWINYYQIHTLETICDELIPKLLIFQPQNLSFLLNFFQQEDQNFGQNYTKCLCCDFFDVSFAFVLRKTLQALSILIEVWKLEAIAAPVRPTPTISTKTSARTSERI